MAYELNISLGRVSRVMAMKAEADFYGGLDPRGIPAYSVAEVATSVRLPYSTVRSWFFGTARFGEVLRPAENDSERFNPLSFFNLIEAHIVAELRRAHRVPLVRVRDALAYLSNLVPVPHPLVEKAIFVTPNQRVYIEHDGTKIDISAGGQYPLDAVVRDLLTRVEWGTRGIVRFFPRVPGNNESPDYAPVVVNPEVCFGRPVIAGTSIPTDVVADRRRGGDSVKRMAEDYHLSEEAIRAALRFEGLSQAYAA